MSAENQHDSVLEELEAELAQHAEVSNATLATQIRSHATGLVQTGYPKEGYPIVPPAVVGIAWREDEQPNLRVAFDRDGFNPAITHRARVTLSVDRRIDENEVIEVGREFVLSFFNKRYLPAMSHAREILPATNEFQFRSDTVTWWAWMAIRSSLEESIETEVEESKEVHTFPELEAFDMLVVQELLKTAFAVHERKGYSK